MPARKRAAGKDSLESAVLAYAVSRGWDDARRGSIVTKDGVLLPFMLKPGFPVLVRLHALKKVRTVIVAVRPAVFRGSGADQRVDAYLVPRHSRARVMEFFTRVNFGLLHGTFALDLSDGEVHYRGSIAAPEGEAPTLAAIEEMVGESLSITHLFFPGLFAMIRSSRTPEEVIDLIGEGELGATFDTMPPHRLIDGAFQDEDDEEAEDAEAEDEEAEDAGVDVSGIGESRTPKPSRNSGS